MNTLGKNKNTTVTTLSSNAMTVTTASASASANMISAFDKQIQKWIELDNKLKKINNEIKTTREMKNDLESSIMEIVNNKKLLNTSISTTDGRLRFIETK